MRNYLKKLFLLTAIIICFIAKGDTAYAATEDFVITADGTLTNYLGRGPTVIIPDTVKVIGERAFEYCKQIEEITVPKSVTEIKKQAFYECRNLKKVNFPTSSASIKILEERVFENCTQLDDLTLPEGLVEIYDYSLTGCTNLKNIKLPSTLTLIRENAFYNCNNLKELTLPKSITYFGNTEYDNQDTIESYKVVPENPKFSSCDGIVYNKEMTTLVYYPPNKKGDTFIVPDSVTEIVDLTNARYLKHIIFGTKLSSCGSMSGCLESYTVPARNKSYCSIDGVLFSKDKKTLIDYPYSKKGEIYKIPEGTKRISNYTFYQDIGDDCYTKLTPVYSELRYLFFPSSIETIGNNVGKYSDGENILPASSFVFYGKKDSIVETYAKENKINFCSYNINKETQLLLTAQKLSLTPTETTQINSILLSTKTQKVNPPISLESSNPSIVSIDQKGNILAKKPGTAVITATTKGGLKASCSVTVKLPSPTYFYASELSPEEIKLTWSKVSDATSYTLYRKITTGYPYLNETPLDSSYTKISTTENLEFIDTNINPEMTYVYLIFSNAPNPCYSSEYSNHLVLTPMEKPENFTAVQTENSITLNWNHNISGYDIILYRSTERDGSYIKISEVPWGKTTSYVDASVQKGITYYYKAQLAHVNSVIKHYGVLTSPVSITVK